MENQKEYCEKLIERWRRLKEKFVQLQDYVSGKDMKRPYSPEKIGEMR